MAESRARPADQRSTASHSACSDTGKIGGIRGRAVAGFPCNRDRGSDTDKWEFHPSKGWQTEGTRAVCQGPGVGSAHTVLMGLTLSTRHFPGPRRGGAPRSKRFQRRTWELSSSIFYYL